MTALALVMILASGSVFAAGETDAAAAASSGVAAEQQNASESQQTEEQPEAVSNVIKKGRYYYYVNPKTGKIRKKKGFVTDCEKRYYIKKGGRIITKKTFKIKKKYYRANRKGEILTGLYKWKKKLNFSNSSGHWIKKEKLVSWEGSRYYIKKGGTVFRNGYFTYKNIPYYADKSGKVTEIDIPEAQGNRVVEVAQKQVGVMTGKTYWKWYFKTRFIDTDRTPWCGTFVAWCYNEAGLYEKVSVARKYGNLGYVPSYSGYADSNDKWIKRSKARGGDIIVFGRNTHVGLVEGVVGDCIITIEGNAGPTALFGCGKAGAVVRKTYDIDSDWIKGIIRVL